MKFPLKDELTKNYKKQRGKVTRALSSPILSSVIDLTSNGRADENARVLLEKYWRQVF